MKIFMHASLLFRMIMIFFYYFNLQNQEDDAMLIAAHLCSDTFSSLSLDAANNGISYSLYTRQVLRMVQLMKQKINL